MPLLVLPDSCDKRRAGVQVDQLIARWPYSTRRLNSLKEGRRKLYSHIATGVLHWIASDSANGTPTRKWISSLVSSCRWRHRLSSTTLTLLAFPICISAQTTAVPTDGGDGSSIFSGTSLILIIVFGIVLLLSIGGLIYYFCFRSKKRAERREKARETAVSGQSVADNCSALINDDNDKEDDSSKKLKSGEKHKTVEMAEMQLHGRPAYARRQRSLIGYGRTESELEMDKLEQLPTPKTNRPMFAITVTTDGGATFDADAEGRYPGQYEEKEEDNGGEDIFKEEHSDSSEEHFETDSDYEEEEDAVHPKAEQHPVGDGFPVADATAVADTTAAVAEECPASDEHPADDRPTADAEEDANAEDIVDYNDIPADAVIPETEEPMEIVANVV